MTNLRWESGEIPAADIQEHLHHWSRGWGVYENVSCDVCGHTWVAVAPVGCKGKECPQCGFMDRDWVWAGLAGEMPNDGVWL